MPGGAGFKSRTHFEILKHEPPDPRKSQTIFPNLNKMQRLPKAQCAPPNHKTTKAIAEHRTTRDAHASWLTQIADVALEDARGKYDTTPRPPAVPRTSFHSLEPGPSHEP